jgi:ferritin-like metal-binding protein YciE
LSRALPRLTKAIQTESAKDAMNQRLEQGERLLQGLDQCFELLQASPGRNQVGTRALWLRL